MFGFRVEKHGGPEVLQWKQLPDPAAKPGQVLLKVAAVGVNHLDVWVRKGVPGHVFPLPLIPGSDIVGTVVDEGPGVDHVDRSRRYFVAPGYSCGRCESCLAGEHQLCRRFGIFGESCDGGYAELVAVPAVNLIPAPSFLSDAEVASFPLAFLTAWHMLVARARIRPGMWVLVHAASSGVSGAAIRIARLFGASTIATASTPEKMEYARQIGTDFVIDYTRQDFLKEVRRITSREGVHVVVDHVGRTTWQQNLGCLRKGGTLVFCGATSGALVETDLKLVFFKNISLLGSTMGSLGEMLEIARLFDSRRLMPLPLRSMPVVEAPEAHALLEERKAMGKLVLEY